VKVQPPTSLSLQCPGCGVPVDATELKVQPTPTTEPGFGLLLEPCGHLVTFELLRDAWGITLPDPDPTRVNYA